MYLELTVQSCTQSWYLCGEVGEDDLTPVSLQLGEWVSGWDLNETIKIRKEVLSYKVVLKLF